MFDPLSHSDTRRFGRQLLPSRASARAGTANLGPSIRPENISQMIICQGRSIKKRGKRCKPDATTAESSATRSTSILLTRDSSAPTAPRRLVAKSLSSRRGSLKSWGEAREILGLSRQTILRYAADALWRALPHASEMERQATMNTRGIEFHVGNHVVLVKRPGLRNYKCWIRSQ
jgi:hypothetical protein